MELIVVALAVLLAIVLFLFAVALNTIARIDETVQDDKTLIAELFDALRAARSEIDDIKTPPSHVSDPFEKPKEIYQSKTHIIVPKTPDQIRNENFKKIQEGAEYGSAS